MNFVIYKTNTLKAAKNCIEELLKAVDRRDIDSPHIVLVPDRASLAAERSLLDAVGGSFNIHVFTFSRYASLVAPQTLKPLSGQMAVLEMMKVIEQNADKLVCFSQSGNTEGFARKIYDVVSLLKYNRIKPEELLSACSDKALMLKLKDIALIYSAFQASVENRYLDSADKLETLLDAIGSSEQIKRSSYYIYDFEGLSVQEEAILENLVRFSRGVYAACAVGKGYMYSNEFFASLNRVASKTGGFKEISRREEGSPCLEARERALLFGSRQAPSVCTREQFTLVNASDAEEEIFYLAAYIDGYVRQGGRYRDIKTVVCDVDEYRDAIRRYFSLFDIPYYLDEKYSLDSHSLFRFVCDFFRMKRADMKLDSVLPVVKNYFFGADEKDVFLFENFCLKYNFGYDFSRFDLGDDEPEETREAAERVRQRLCRLAETDVPDRAAVSVYVDIVRDFLRRNDLYAQLEALAKKLESRAPDYYARFSLQAGEKLDAVLDELGQTAGGLYVDVEKFLGFFSAAAGDVNVSILPLYADCVEIANLDKSLRHDIRTLAVVGANEGKLPLLRSDSALLNDDNLKKLVKNGLRVTPDVATLNRNDCFALAMLLLEPEDRLYVSFRSVDSDGSGLKPSSFVRALKKAHVRPDGSEIEAEQNPDFGVHSKRWAVYRALEARAEGQNLRAESADEALGCELEKYLCAYTPEIRLENGKELFFRSGAASVTRIEEFYKCPFRHFLSKGGLMLKERDVARLKPTDLGSIVHDCLEKFVRFIIAHGVEKADENVMRKIFDAVTDGDRYKAVQRDRLSRHNLSRLKEETVKIAREIKEQLENSEFFPVECEAEFGPHAAFPAPSVQVGEGAGIRFRGKIDRIDRCGKEFIIIDYKRGQSVFREKDLYAGVKLQLPVYLKVVRDALGLEPAGFFYKKLNNDFVRSEFREFGGRVVDDVDTICRLDTTFKQNGRSERLHIRVNKNGTLNRQNRVALTRAQLDAYVNYAWRMIEQAGREMAQGNAGQSPYEDACDYCEFAEICDFNDLSGRQSRCVTASVTAETLENAGGEKNS